MDLLILLTKIILIIPKLDLLKPNGSLAYPYLGGSLRSIGVETYVYDIF